MLKNTANKYVEIFLDLLTHTEYYNYITIELKIKS